MNIKSTLMALIILAMAMPGTACGPPPVPYSRRTLPLNVRGSATVTVAVHDQRKYIVSGRTHAAYIGQVRGSFGIPHSRYTPGSEILSTAIAQSIAGSLTRVGFRARAIATSPKEPHAAIVGRLRGAGRSIHKSPL